MKKIILIIALVGCLALVSAGLVFADLQSFGVSASVPFSSGITFTATEIQANGTWTDVHPSILNFGTLVYDAQFKIFRPTKYFAIDLGVVSGGAGKPDNIQFVYTEGASHPNIVAGNGRGGLGQKGTLQVTKAVLDGDDIDVGSEVLLNNVATLGTISKSNFLNGWPRVYVGIYDGSDEALNTAGWEVFNADDAPGEYFGILEITATVN